MDEMTTFLTEYRNSVTHDIFIILVILCIAADTIFGCIRAVKFRKWNSSIGIDGGIRKITMLFSVLFLALVDLLVGINAAALLPDSGKEMMAALNLDHVGLAQFFCIVYILYEATSILKNMLLCGVPAPAGLEQKLAGWLDNMTDESVIDISQTVASHSDTQILKKTE